MREESSGVAKETLRLRFRVGLLLCFVAGFIVAYMIFILRVFPTWESRSLFGNSLAGLTTIFSGLGLLGVGLALSLQARELEAQGQAVEASLEEQAAMREMLIRQTRALSLGALAQLAVLQQDTKHRGYGSGSVKAQMDTLEDLAERVRKELESNG